MSGRKVCPIVGAGKVLPRYVLPTLKDVFRYNLHLNTRLGICQVTNDVILCWKTIGVPTVSVQRVQHMLLSSWKEYRTVLKSIRRIKSNDTYQIEGYKLECSKLFDISKCKCVTKCGCLQTPLPVKLFDFLQDQRTLRIQKFECSMKEVINKYKMEEPLVEEMENDSNIEFETISVNDEDSLWGCNNVQKSKGANNTVKLEATAVICDRYGFSNRGAAALVTAVLEDFGIVTANDKRLVIDHSKIRRARTKIRKKVRLSSKVTSCNGLFFDGRKDKTRKTTITNNIRRTKIVKEEHISILAEPGSKYIGHISPVSGSAVNVTNDILKHLNDENISNDFDAVGTDGTNLNTGWKKGVIMSIEKRLLRPLLWLVCLLHLNELPLRHLFRHLDGPTTGPRGFKGIIGQQLKKATKLPIVKFKRIPCTLPILTKDISTDQKYLYNMCVAISNGKVSESLAMNEPGNICHSRWLTIANRILRVYVGTAEPSKKLVILTKYILTVYAPVWFTIKRNWKCWNGASNLYKLFASTRYLPAYLKRIVDPVLQRNAYFAHPENILLCMLCDDRRKIRELAVQRILVARSAQNKNKVRVFRVPTIKFNAKYYTQMIDWNKETITEPPLTFRMSETELRLASEIKKKPHSFDLPCHTQSVERCVKLVTEASIKVDGADNRDGYIRSTLLSRSTMAQFDTKKHYAVHKVKIVQ